MTITGKHGKHKFLQLWEQGERIKVVSDFPDLIASHFIDELWPMAVIRFSISDHLPKLIRSDCASFDTSHYLHHRICIAFCCLLQQPTTMSDDQKCQCHGCQLNSSELRLCGAASCGNVWCLPCLKDLYGKFSLQ